MKFLAHVRKLGQDDFEVFWAERKTENESVEKNGQHEKGGQMGTYKTGRKKQEWVQSSMHGVVTSNLKVSYSILGITKNYQVTILMQLLRFFCHAFHCAMLPPPISVYVELQLTGNGKIF